MIKKFFTRIKSAKQIAESYSNYSEYAHNASDSEKQKVIEDTLKKANEMQREVAAPTH
jgi:hypothetical protein